MVKLFQTFFIGVLIASIISNFNAFLVVLLFVAAFRMVISFVDSEKDKAEVENYERSYRQSTLENQKDTIEFLSNKISEQNRKQ
jgi:uncharacterized membrane protein